MDTINQGKTPIEELSKEEIISKYKVLLGIAKQAKKSKDELAEENRTLKETISRNDTQNEADKKSLQTMSEMLEQFTENKLQMATQLSELQRKSKADAELLDQLSIENESLNRQINSLTEDNESLLNDIDRMEDQLKQVNVLGLEQKKHLALLEHEVNKLKEAENLSACLQSQIIVTTEESKAFKEELNTTKQNLAELLEKYQNVKEINSEQCKKFNGLKDRFIEVHRKLKQLKECRRVLLETQHEYAEAVSKWQNEIIKASQLLCAQMNTLRKENVELLEKCCAAEHGSKNAIDVENITIKVTELYTLTANACAEYSAKSSQLDILQQENETLKRSLAVLEQVGVEQMQAQESKATQASVKECDRHQLEIKRLSQGLKDLKNKLRDNEDNLKALQNENDALKQKLSQQNGADVAEAYCKDNLDNEELRYKLNEQVEKIRALELQIKCHQKEEQLLEKENTKIVNKLSKMAATNDENERLRAEIVEMACKLSQHDKIQEDLQETQNMLKAVQQENQELRQSDRGQKANESDNSQNSNEAYEELVLRYEQKEREHADLLGEMRELNEALKARGDVISRQQEKHQELVAELKCTTTKLKQIEEKLNEKDAFLLVKDEELRHIRTEIDETRNKVNEFEGIFVRNEEQVRTLNEELQKLRSADYQSDVLSTSTISHVEELSRLREVDESFEEKYNKLRGLAVKLKKKLQEQTAYLAELEKNQSGSKALNEELEALKTQFNDVQCKYDQSAKIIETLKTENQKLKLSRKQANMLNLEIEAAEKSLNEATGKLAAKITELEELKETLKTKEKTIVQLRKEIAILESAKMAECTHSKELKEQVDRLQAQIKDEVHGKQNALVANKELEQLQQNLKLELEDMRLQLSTTASRHEEVLSTTSAEKEQLSQQLLQMEETLKTTHANLKTAERSFEDLRVEYIDYKVKAQAVLRKNQSKDSSKERELEEELVALHAVEKQLETSVQIHIKKIEESDKQIELVKEDNDNLQRRANELLSVIEELRQQNENLAHENRSQIVLQQESLKNHRQQIENLDACHNEQLKELEACHARQIEQLKAEHAKAIRMPPTIGAAKTTFGLGSVNANSELNSKIDFLLMEREDAEGSEEAEALATIAANRKISTTMNRYHNEIMPLDELLNAPMNTISGDTVISGEVANRLGHLDSNANSNDEKTYVELQETKQRLQIQESRVRHLTALLAENEQDLAKLTQLNDMLKEELRRQERTVEREKHMHNSEYLKNVIIKFLTLNNGDERTRLVPVINTILKLSRSETEILNCVAKGQKVSVEANNRSWSNFLPSWGNNN